MMKLWPLEGVRIFFSYIVSGLAVYSLQAFGHSLPLSYTMRMDLHPSSQFQCMVGLSRYNNTSNCMVLARSENRSGTLFFVNNNWRASYMASVDATVRNQGKCHWYSSYFSPPSGPFQPQAISETEGIYEELSAGLKQSFLSASPLRTCLFLPLQSQTLNR